MQLILPIEQDNRFNLNEFIVSSSNIAAYNRIKDSGANWGHLPFVCSLLLHGPKSSGKTYLTKIWQHYSKAYLINLPENLTNTILSSHEAFIIEDIEKFTENSLLHCFNLINENKKRLLLTTSNLNNNFKLKDLASRINSLAKIEIKQPDDELIKLLLFKLFSSYSVKISNQVVDFLLPRLPRQFDHIIMIVQKLNELAMLYKRSVTIPLIKKWIQTNDLKISN
jgi:chromosomal replication initiation ATPase DnaA